MPAPKPKPHKISLQQISKKYRVIGLTNCTKPRIREDLTEKEVQKLIDTPNVSVSIK